MGDQKDTVLYNDGSRHDAAGFEDRGMSHEPWKARNAALETGKNKGMEFSLKPLETMRSCQHLGLSPVGPILDC